MRNAGAEILYICTIHVYRFLSASSPLLHQKMAISPLVMAAVPLTPRLIVSVGFAVLRPLLAFASRCRNGSSHIWRRLWLKMR